MQAADRSTIAPAIQLPGYRIERLIAEGGMASVYLAEQVSLRRRVALKILRQFDEPSEAKRFVNEGRIIASLNHRNIITIHDIGRLGDRFYLAMEYLEGGTLSHRIRAGMNPSEVLELLAAIAGCLDFVHRRGIVHRDVKPSNILFHADGTPVLTDFGVAKNFGSNQSLTQDGSAVGSPYYLSPEQARSRQLDGRSDIYSLGVICFEMLTGEKPFRGESVVDTLLAHMKQPLPRLQAPLTPLQPLIHRMLAKQASDRYDSAQQLLGDIERLRETVARIDDAIADTPIRAAAHGTDSDTTVMLSTTGARTTKSRGYQYLTVAIWLGVLVSGIAGWWQAQRPAPIAAVASHSPATTPQSTETIAPAPRVASPAPLQTTPSPIGPPPVVPLPDPSPADPITTAAGATTTTPAPKPARTVPPAPARVVKKSPAAGRARLLLRQAERALREYRLTTPPRDNARHYFAQLREHQPRHPALRNARHRIAEAYADLAEGKLNKLEYEAAQVFVTRGLELESGNPRLLGLQQEVRDMRRAQNLFYRAADALFN